MPRTVCALTTDKYVQLQLLLCVSLKSNEYVGSRVVLTDGWVNGITFFELIDVCVCVHVWGCTSLLWVGEFMTPRRSAGELAMHYIC